MTIRIFITGGTFDKEYDELTGKLFFNKTHLREMLDLGRSKVDVNISTLMMKDSLEMDDIDRELIVDNCCNASENQIIITHGTDTMTTTAQEIAKANLDKVIVLTGAMIPYKFGSSDGLFNLGGAIGFVQSLKTGVYIAMNGKYFDYDKVEKNKESGEFIAI
ncbi:MAG: asparaginase domain-containing protein [Candidatus Neomarinimicrobiota bacterium]|nr:asparaginase domain-containing protein [Candidatus Neomarinimicrobiota bacterium]MEE3302471.1 asparaginase domain-containing protein [Candidatus Neomarinimicrobiota bacterium]|tara:strand:+ start:411 stop:896 length:486 start_codon:yes stop_codon:yes gene_type:complete